MEISSSVIIFPISVGILSPTSILLFKIFFLFIHLREKQKYQFVVRDWTLNLGVLGRCSNQLSYLARAYFAFYKNDLCLTSEIIFFYKTMPSRQSEGHQAGPCYWQATRSHSGICTGSAQEEAPPRLWLLPCCPHKQLRKAPVFRPQRLTPQSGGHHSGHGEEDGVPSCLATEPGETHGDSWEEFG